MKVYIDEESQVEKFNCWINWRSEGLGGAIRGRRTCRAGRVLFIDVIFYMITLNGGTGAETMRT